MSQPSRPLTAEEENAILRHIVAEVSWMARRYADGRMTYAARSYNDAIRQALSLGIMLNPGGERTIWARDGHGRGFDGLSDEEAAAGEPVAWTRIVAEEEQRRLDAIGVLVQQVGVLHRFLQLDGTETPARTAEQLREIAGRDLPTPLADLMDAYAAVLATARPEQDGERHAP